MPKKKTKKKPTKKGAKVNFKEAIEVIRKLVVEEGQDPDPDYGNFDDNDDFQKLQAAGFKIEEEEREGGEDQGSEYHVVLKLTNGNQSTFVKCDAAYYMSYDGTTWEGGDVYEVEKKEVKVEQWVKS